MSFGRGGLGLILVALALGQPRLLVIAILYSIAASMLVWSRRTWSFDGHTITLDDGVISRTYRRVPVSRVQQVEVNEPFAHRMVGFAVVRIETAGAAGQAEILLDALPHAEALAVQREVLQARARALQAPTEGDGEAGTEGDDTTEVQPPPPEVEILSLSTGRVMLAGVTGSNLLVVFAVMGTLFDTVSRLPQDLAAAVEDEAGTLLSSLGFLAGALMLVVLALVAAALSAVATHHGLTVVRAGDELRLRRGLFERRDAVVPLARVQAIAVRQNPAHRVLGLASVQIRSAGTAVGGDARLSVPLANRDEVDRLVAAGVGRRVELDELDAAPPPARGRRVVRRAGIAAVAVAVAAVVTAEPVSIGVVAVAASVLAFVLGLDAYRNLGHRLDQALLVTRWGSLWRRTVVTVIPRVQSSRVTASPFQRWRSLATLRVDLAGRGITPMVLDQRAERCIELDRELRARASLPTRSPSPTVRPVPPLLGAHAAERGLGAGDPVRDTGPAPPPLHPHEEP